jgi:AcrR family transcriptional regulator
MAINPAPLEPALSPFRSTRTTSEERGQKRAALLLAAVRMFNERGFHATSLEDVATSLGVTKPVIYHHLGNKDQVLLECVTMGLGELQAAVVEARAGPGNGLDRLRAFLRRYAEVIMGEFGRCVVRTGDEVLSPAARTRFRALKREIHEALRGMVEDAVEDGSARNIDVAVTANAFAGALNWPARWYRPDGTLAPTDMAAALVDILIAGVENKGST